MVSEFDIKYVIRDSRRPPFNCVTHIGGELSSGDRWQISVEEAIDGITTGRFAFTITREDNEPEQLKVEQHPLYGPVLKSVLDGQQPQALMTMPEAKPIHY